MGGMGNLKCSQLLKPQFLVLGCFVSLRTDECKEDITALDLLFEFDLFPSPVYKQECR